MTNRQAEMRRKMRIFLIVVTICTVLSLFPIKLTLAPERNIKIQNLNEKPIKDATVRQVWCQYSLGVKGEEDFKVNSDGTINLPKREVSTNIFMLFIGALNNFRKYFINAGYGSRESLGVFAQGYSDRWIHDPKNKRVDAIILEEARKD
jgi:hypothetical protein